MYVICIHIRICVCMYIVKNVYIYSIMKHGLYTRRVSCLQQYELTLFYILAASILSAFCIKQTITYARACIYPELSAMYMHPCTHVAILLLIETF